MLWRTKMEFVFIVAIAAFFTAGMLYVVKSSDKKSKNEDIEVIQKEGISMEFTELTEDEYDILVDTNKVDDNVFYFIEETE